VGGLSGIADTLNQLLEQGGVTLAPWAIPAVIALAFLAMLPWLQQNHRLQRARSLVQAIASEREVDREALRAAALALVADHPMGLVGLADEALRQGLNDLARAALVQLKTHGKPVRDIHRLHAVIHGPPPAHLEGELAAIEKLLRNSMRSAARERLQRALRTWPDAPELSALAAAQAEE